MAKIRNVPFPRPCGATVNDAQKLHAPAFAHFRGGVLRHEVFCPFSAEHTANQAAGFDMKSAAFFVLKKFFEFFRSGGKKMILLAGYLLRDKTSFLVILENRIHTQQVHS